MLRYSRILRDCYLEDYAITSKVYYSDGQLRYVLVTCGRGDKCEMCTAMVMEDQRQIEARRQFEIDYVD
jgi:hypothetical protein